MAAFTDDGVGSGALRWLVDTELDARAVLVAFSMAVAWWASLTLGEHDAASADASEPAGAACRWTDDLVFSRLTLRVEWGEQVGVEMRGVVRSTSDRALARWCLEFGKDLRVVELGLGRSDGIRRARGVRSVAGNRRGIARRRASGVDGAVGSTTYRGTVAGRERWQMAPSRRLDPDETLVVSYRGEVGADRAGLAVLDRLVPRFGKPADRGTTHDRARGESFRRAGTPLVAGATIEIELDFSLTAAGSLPGILVRHWCRNDRRVIRARWTVRSSNSLAAAGGARRRTKGDAFDRRVDVHRPTRGSLGSAVDEKTIGRATDHPLARIRVHDVGLDRCRYGSIPP